MGPNGFMGTSLLPLQIKVLLKNVYIYEAFRDDAFKKNVKRFPVFTAHNFTSAGHIRDFYS